MTRFAQLTTALVLAALATGAGAAAEPPAQALVRDTTTKVLDALRDQRDVIEENPDSIYRLVDELIIPHFDFSRMSKRVLGRHWRDANEEQRARFVDEFQKLLVRTYATALNEYKDQSVEYLASREHAGRDEVSVRTQVSSPGAPPIPITYEMYRVGDAWKVYDVTIDGVSLVINYRSTFNSEIQRNGLDGLIARLAEKNEGRRGE